MFSPEVQVRIFLYDEPVSKRLSFEGLYALARDQLQQDPLSGNVFAVNQRPRYVAQGVLLRLHRAMCMGKVGIPVHRDQPFRLNVTDDSGGS
jgi:hypothetical protein